MSIEHSITYSACRIYSTAKNIDFYETFPVRDSRDSSNATQIRHQLFVWWTLAERRCRQRALDTNPWCIPHVKEFEISFLL